MTNKRKPLNEKIDKFIFGEDDSNGKTTAKSKEAQKQSNDLLGKLTKESTAKEKPIRVSLDLTPEMHKKLTSLANRTGRAKAEILRILLEQAFDEIDIE